MITPIKKLVPGPAGALAIYVQGDPSAPVVLMSPSILSTSMMWSEQADLLAAAGWCVVRADTRGHGASFAAPAPYAMSDLVADTVAVLDALQIERAHYVGLSLGGMTGLGLGIHQAKRLLSLCLCDLRADATPAFAAPWDERIAIATEKGCGALAESTAERWFGKAFVQANPAIALRFHEAMAATSLAGFVGCSRALQQLDYLPDVARITTPTTLIVGANDGPLPLAMQELQKLIAGAVLEVIPDAAHLPNITQPAAFNAALLRHFERFNALRTCP